MEQSLNNTDTAITYYEEALMKGSGSEYLGKSLIELVKIHINSGDFYAAYHLISQNHNHKSPEVEVYNIFLEGSIQIIKKKYSEGLSKLFTLFNNNSQLEFLQPLLLKYVAYALFKEGRHK